MNQKIKKVFGAAASPAAQTKQRLKHMGWIKRQFKLKYGIKNRITKGKTNQNGKFIKKPDWTTGWLEYEPNPEAAIEPIKPYRTQSNA